MTQEVDKKIIEKFRVELDKERRNWNTDNELANLTNQGINIGHDEAFRIGEKLILEAMQEAEREGLKPIQAIVNKYCIESYNGHDFDRIGEDIVEFINNLKSIKPK